ncbi:TetR/AcrR family transcriptional regulator [Pseudonocardia sp. TRM90224]|uniref:TetR/AcrR family transcriptional regulator n=1 Tax=Pseudonocardia sp. TRM90224 TaxID=2812678 RepID=UPI001E2B7CFF|nr:TetR/AcrR family transcriptional regulator [Pseudonocardia sp. TRM90224]
MHSGTQADAAGSFIEQARRAQIVRATIEVLAAQGFGAASFVRIAERASISPALISYHFRTKDALMGGVLATIEKRLDEAMAGGGEEEPASYPDALRGMLERFVAHCSAHGDEISAMTEIRRAASMRATVAKSHERGAAELVAFIEEGQRYGQFRATDAALFASVLMSAMGEVPRLLRNRPDEHRRIAVEWAALFVHAISADTTPAWSEEP